MTCLHPRLCSLREECSELESRGGDSGFVIEDVGGIGNIFFHCPLLFFHIICVYVYVLTFDIIEFSVRSRCACHEWFRVTASRGGSQIEQAEFPRYSQIVSEGLQGTPRGRLHGVLMAGDLRCAQGTSYFIFILLLCYCDLLTAFCNRCSHARNGESAPSTTCSGGCIS